jgi:hypothetical protein
MFLWDFICMLLIILHVKKIRSNISYVPLGFHMYAVYLQQWIFVCMNTETSEQRKNSRGIIFNIGVCLFDY